MIRKLLMALALLAVSPLALCAEPVPDSVPADGVRARLADTPVLRGQFEQRKTLQGFRNPLVSSGDFLLVRDRGVAWDTREPFPSSTLLTRDRLLATMPDGSQRVLVDAAQSPAMAAVNSLLLALVSGDLDALAVPFTLEETLLADGAWTLHLVPREPALARLFKYVELRGNHHVRDVVLQETAGDHTHIRFVSLDDSPAEATVQESARFD